MTIPQHTLCANNLSTGYPNHTVIQDLNIALPSNKVSVIIGGNGCGKSTLLKSFCRLGKVLNGSILLDGKQIHEYHSKEFAQKLGLLPQTPVVPEGISVIDLVARGRFPYQKFMQRMNHSDYEKIQQALEIMGISDLADRNIDELSGGQRQRVWIALALAQDSDILLLDEPTTYLDIAYQVEILEIMKELNRKKGITIAMVLHEINLACRYADHLFAMKNGKLFAEGSPKDIVTEHLMREVFDLESKIIEDPVFGTPFVIPIGKNPNT